MKINAEPSRMLISSAKGIAEICFTADDTINFRSHGLTFGLFIVTICG